MLSANDLSNFGLVYLMSEVVIIFRAGIVFEM